MDQSSPFRLSDIRQRMLAVRIQAIDGARTCTLLGSQHCRLLPPHVGLSAFMRRINWRICAFAFGRPGRRRCDRHRQNRWKPARCQETTVSGLTMIRASDQPATAGEGQPIEAIQFGPGLLPLEDRELLAKSDGFQREFVTWQEKGPQVSHQRTAKGNHDSILVEGRPAGNR